MKQYRIDGGKVQSIADLYEQLNRELMAEQDWTLRARPWTGLTTSSTG
ncbi:hypothetical protein [Arthrobacter psychrolactophilus]